VADFVIKTNDLLQVTLAPPAVVPLLMAPVPLLGTGLTVLVNHQPICLEGDELPPAVRLPLMYTAPPFITPGFGTLSVTLTPANKTLKVSANGKPALIKGATFTATFSVTAPALQPTPVGPLLDPVVTKPGTAQFVTTTVNVQAG